MVQDHRDYLKVAKDILKKNRRDGFTIPTSRLYPFQWNWDSAFISMGYARFDVEAAITELETLVSGQWDNGMIPHIIFHSEDETTYFPNWDYWDAAVNKGAPRFPKTSGITQPPVIAIALLHLAGLYQTNTDMVGRIASLYEAACRFQSFWYTHRDPHDEGLVSIIHPWESGRDNSPVWDEALDAIKVDKSTLPEYKRRDVAIADASQRPTDRQYDQYVYLMQLAHRHGYDGRGIFRESGFLMQDCLVNALLIRSNFALIELGRALGDDTTQLEQWNGRSIEAFNRKLWSDELNVYCSFDLHRDRLVALREVGGMAAIYAGCCPKERTAGIAGDMKLLRDRGYLLVPSFDPAAEGFDPKRYWRGPVWPQMNWLIYRGLRESGYDILAANVRKDIVDLIEAFGFREYFDPRRTVLKDGRGGYGGDQFSWTASSFIDLIYD